MNRFLLLLIVAAATFFEAWMFMLLVGVIHGEWLPMLPTIGFWASWRLALTVTAVAVVATFVAEFIKAFDSESL